VHDIRDEIHDFLAGRRARIIPQYAEPAPGRRRAEVAVGADGSLWLLANNTDGRGGPTADDDRVIRMPAT
jgi:hypothetical protein